MHTKPSSAGSFLVDRATPTPPLPVKQNQRHNETAAGCCQHFVYKFDEQILHLHAPQKVAISDRFGDHRSIRPPQPRLWQPPSWCNRTGRRPHTETYENDVNVSRVFALYFELPYT